MAEASCVDAGKNGTMEFKPGDLAKMVKEGREEDVFTYLASADTSTEKWQEELDNCVVIAAKHKEPGIMRHLLEAGANVMYGSEFRYPILDAVFRSGDLKVLDIYLEQVKRNHLNQAENASAVFLFNAAVASRTPECFTRVCAALQELDIALPNESSCLISPFHTLVACYDTGSLATSIAEIMELLLGQGFDINRTDNNRNTPLHIAAREGNRAGVRELIKHGADLVVRDGFRCYPWMTARIEGHDDIMLEILQAVDLSEHRDVLESFLHEACKSNWKSVVGCLLDKGVDINCTDNENCTPLIVAAKSLSSGVVECLVSYNHCDVNFDGGAVVRSAVKEWLFDSDEYIANWTIFGHERPGEIISCLVRAGADLNIRDQHDYTMLMDNEIYASRDCRNLLIQYGADVNAVARDGLSVLWTAVRCNPNTSASPELGMELYDECDRYERHQYLIYRSVLDDLLEQNIDIGVSQYQHRGETPLQAAFCDSDPTLCKILLDADCSLYEMREFISSREWNLDEDMKQVKARILEMCDEPYSLKAQARLAVLRAIGQSDIRENLHRLNRSKVLPKALVNYLGKAIEFNLDNGCNEAG